MPISYGYCSRLKCGQKNGYEGEGCEHYAYQSRKMIVLNMLNSAKGSIADVGCGPAIYSEELLARGLEVTAVDLSPEMLASAQARLGEKAAQINWVNAQIEELPFENDTYDNLISIGVIAYASDAGCALRELARVLKPGGLLVMQSSNSLCPASILTKIKDEVLYAAKIRQRPYDFNLARYSFGRFKRLLQDAGFDVIEKQSYDFRLPFLEKCCQKGAVKLMKMLHPVFSKSRIFGWLGEGYIVKARKQ